MPERTCRLPRELATYAHGRALGFLGRAAIHPRRLAVIRRSYLPDPGEIATAKKVIKVAEPDGGALARPDGRDLSPARHFAKVRRGRQCSIGDG